MRAAGLGLALVWAALTVSPLAARAAEGLYLSWDDCPFGASSQNSPYLCNNVFDFQRLVGSFGVPMAVDSVIGIEAVVDLQHADASVPAWWQFGAGGCNAPMLSVDASFEGLTACPDAWGGWGGGLLQDYLVGQPRGLPSQARFVIAVVVPSTQARTLEPEAVYYGFRITLRDERLVSCPGCQSPACLVLNSVRLLRMPGAADLLLQAPGASGSNVATWRGGAGANCDAVPVRNLTWGRIKSLYH